MFENTSIIKTEKYFFREYFKNEVEKMNKCNFLDTISQFGYCFSFKLSFND